MVEYGRQYINLVQDDYSVVWWNCVDASKWGNVLAIFCIPVANGHLERVFSQLKLIKTNRRTSIKDNTLDQLVRVNVEGPPLSEWGLACAMHLWWRERARRINRNDSPASAAGPTSPEIHEEPEQDQFDWEEWEELIGERTN